MPERTVTVGLSSGLHARPATAFARAAAEQPVPVTVARDGRPAVPARSLLSVLALGAGHGDTVTLAAEGDGAEAALDALAGLLTHDHDD
ncbi:MULTISPECIES: HPr family phosphocarrier protein [Streptomyces]|jgi:phosphocarrier protein HPr|uniref:Phosphocarrier protein HPr n=1 Tax=Streptomyces doudnae TaxID=3075536 RepID=A0ABD5EPC7_9ACTN|nr:MULTISPECIES: HPr family phosphocarrier protein [unclassified Streptomyces]MDT0436461.1 HPr family phosphocarrier protein [Streptomyces sp. DSM 41981]MYQ65914.1 HPr family phosphocarrier protein [Streptomyces sp. SID4950]SCE10243.1 Phosphocarrier protein HPr [Streptomyces sp. SolWspMP-5a-2]